MGSAENDQHQKMITMVKSENEFFFGIKKESDHHVGFFKKF